MMACVDRIEMFQAVNGISFCLKKDQLVPLAYRSMLGKMWWWRLKLRNRVAVIVMRLSLLRIKMMQNISSGHFLSIDFLRLLVVIALSLKHATTKRVFLLLGQELRINWNLRSCPKAVCVVYDVVIIFLTNIICISPEKFF